MSIQDPLRYYLERRTQRAKLAAARIAAGLASGLAAAGLGCPAGLALYALLYAATLHPKVSKAMPEGRLSKSEARTVGLASSLAALVLGLVIGSVLA